MIISPLKKYMHNTSYLGVDDVANLLHNVNPFCCNFSNKTLKSYLLVRSVALPESFGMRVRKYAQAVRHNGYYIGL